MAHHAYPLVEQAQKVGTKDDPMSIQLWRGHAATQRHSKAPISLIYARPLTLDHGPAFRLRRMGYAEAVWI